MWLRLSSLLHHNYQSVNKPNQISVSVKIEKKSKKKVSDQKITWKHKQGRFKNQIWKCNMILYKRNLYFDMLLKPDVISAELNCY